MLISQLLKKNKKSFHPILNDRGMTLIEILAVLALLGIVAALLVTKVTGKLDEGKVEATRIQMQSVAGYLEDFRRHCNRYPTTEEGLNALITKPATLADCKRYRPMGYIETGKLPKDSWDRDYIYKSPDNGRTFEIISYGIDGIEGGENFDADISSKDI